jgi:hypothetical protein
MALAPYGSHCTIKVCKLYHIKCIHTHTYIHTYTYIYIRICAWYDVMYVLHTYMHAWVCVLMYVRVCACVSADNVSALVHLPYKSQIKYGGIQSIFETFATYKPLYSRMEAPLPSTSTVPYKGHLCNIEVYGVIFFLRFFFLSHYTIQRPTIQYGGILSIFETFATYKPLYSRMEATLPSTSTVPYKGHLYNMEVYRIFLKRLPRISPYTAVWKTLKPLYHIKVNYTIQRYAEYFFF